MRTFASVIVATSAFVAGLQPMCPARADGLSIESFDPSGNLTFSDVPGSAVYVVETAPALTGLWTSAWAGQACSGHSATVDVAQAGTRFYRAMAGVTNAASPVPNGMVLIPAGSFQMGYSFAEGATNDTPVHNVYISAFFMDRTEVTWEKWQEVRDWSVTNGYDLGSVGAGKASDHPVQMVAWYEAVKWCNARNEMEGKAVCYRLDGATYKVGYNDSVVCDWSAGGYRLPTEAEWEKAARGGLSGKLFPWGGSINWNDANYRAGDSELSSGANPYSDGTYHPDYDDYPIPYTSPVGSFAPNGYGLYDMAGNLAEWCWDWFDSSNFVSSPGTDPKGPPTGTDRLLRGGSWGTIATRCQVDCRGTGPPGFRHHSRGFRTVMPVVQQ